MQISTFQITGLHCESCSRLIQRRLSKISDVKNVEVKEDGMSIINAEREIDKNEVIQALADTDYKVV